MRAYNGVFKNHFTFICVCVCLYTCVPQCVCVRAQIGGQLTEVISLRRVGSRDQVQATRLDSKYPYLPHLAGPYNGILDDVCGSH